MDTQSMSTAELLALLVGRENAGKISQRTLAEVFDGANEKIRPHPKVLAARELVMRWLREELQHRDVLSTPATVRNYLRLLFADRQHEVFVTIFLDAQNHVLAAEELFRGTLSQTSVYPREVVKLALQKNAAGVIFAHNHPSGLAEPSRSDEALTAALKQALALVDVKVLDHFVVGGGVAMSFAERGLL